MADSTRGVIATPNKDPFFIGNLLRRSLAKISDVKSVELSPYADSLMCNINYQGRNRTLYALFMCDVDNRKVAEESITLSLGADNLGHSVQIMDRALRALSTLGQCYIEKDNALDYGLELFDSPPLNLLEAAREGCVILGHASLRSWVQQFDRGGLHPDFNENLSAALGFDESIARELLSVEFSYREFMEVLDQVYADFLATKSTQTAFPKP